MVIMTIFLVLRLFFSSKFLNFNAQLKYIHQTTSALTVEYLHLLCRSWNTGQLFPTQLLPIQISEKMRHFKLLYIVNYK